MYNDLMCDDPYTEIKQTNERTVMYQSKVQSD